MTHDTLVNFYKTNFYLIHQYGWSLSDIEAQMPWERDVFIGQLLQYIEQQKKDKE